MNLDVLLLLLRLVFVGLLYVFLIQVVLALRHNLHTEAEIAHPADPATGARLAVLDGLKGSLPAGTAFQLLPITTIGRSSKNVIVLDDSFVSASHAMLAFRDDQWWLEDTGSTNGTLVNHRQIESPTRVTYGDVISIGGVELKLIFMR